MHVSAASTPLIRPPRAASRAAWNSLRPISLAQCPSPGLRPLDHTPGLQHVHLCNPPCRIFQPPAVVCRSYLPDPPYSGSKQRGT